MDEKKHHHAGSFASHMYVEILEVLLVLYSSKDTLMNTARRMYEQVPYLYTAIMSIFTNMSLWGFVYNYCSFVHAILTDGVTYKRSAGCIPGFCIY